MIRGIADSTLLNNGIRMPWLGLGVLHLKEGGEVEKAVRVALQNGYRLIDCASRYYNEEGVGRGIQQSGIPREEIFLSSKIPKNEQGYKTTFKAFQKSLDLLKTDYLDSYLIHWPRAELSLETWKAMEELYEKGKIKAIGISNFDIYHLDYFLPKIKIIPAINQVEFHPYYTRVELREYCKKYDIQFQGWSPFMQGSIIGIPTFAGIAARYKKTPAQVILRWNLQNGVISIPRSGIPEEIISNTQIFDFELKAEDMAEISSLNRNKKTFHYYDHIPSLYTYLKNNKNKLPVVKELIRAFPDKIYKKIKYLVNSK